MASPDPRCLLRLDLVARTPARWVLELPVFMSSAELARSAWHDYVHSLYAPLDAADFPIDLRCFTFWWHKRLPPSLIARYFAPHFLRSPVPASAVQHVRHGKAGAMMHYAANGDVVPMGSQGAAWQIVMTSDVRRASAAAPEPLSPGYQHGRSQLVIPFVTPLPAGSRVEVYHEGGLDCSVRPAEIDLWYRNGLSELGGDSTARSAQQRKVAIEARLRHAGYWVHVSPGSGIWAELGRTLAIGTDGGHDEACAQLLQTDKSLLKPGWGHTIDRARHTCGSRLFSLAHVQMARVGRRLGYDSVQGLPCDDPLTASSHYRHQINVCRYSTALIAAREHGTPVGLGSPSTFQDRLRNASEVSELPAAQATWLRPFEVLLLRSTCDANGTIDCAVDRGACPVDGLLTRGRGRIRQPCRCDGTQLVVNCDGQCAAPHRLRSDQQSSQLYHHRRAS